MAIVGHCCPLHLVLAGSQFRQGDAQDLARFAFHTGFGLVDLLALGVLNGQVTECGFEGVVVADAHFRGRCYGGVWRRRFVHGMSVRPSLSGTAQKQCADSGRQAKEGPHGPE